MNAQSLAAIWASCGIPWVLAFHLSPTAAMAAAGRPDTTPGSQLPASGTPGATPAMGLGSELEIREVHFEPLAVGKNAVLLKAHNRLPRNRTLGLDIRATSPRATGRASAWQTQYFLELAADATVPARFAFKIPQPLSEDSVIRLRFYSLNSAEQFKLDQFQQQAIHRAAELKWRPSSQAPPQPAPEPQAALARSLLRQVQGHLRSGQYPEAVGAFTKDYCDLEIMGRAWSRSDADQLRRLFEGEGFRSFWDKDEFLELQPGAVFVENGALRLEATRADQTWTFGLVQEGGPWRIDTLSGFKPASAGWRNWTDRLLPRLEQRRTEHFDIYYFAGSTAQRRIDDIARRREEGLAAICKFLQSEPAGRMRLVLFEDGRTKHKETGHQGSGWATGQTIVEVYNDQTQLNPYHEAVHIVAAQVGSPPALFNEGLAVYLSEHLRASGPEASASGKLPVDDRAAQWLRQGEWIDLPELMTYTEIGSKRSRPQVSYPLAASFVKFLVERYGRDKFLEAYGALRNSTDSAIQVSNAQACHRIYGLPVERLEEAWRQALLRRPGTEGVPESEGTP